MNSHMSKKTYTLALGGICLAFAVICICAGTIVPGAELTLFALSGIFTGVIILETGLRGGIVFYVAAIILSFFLSPNKLAIIPYVFFFGIYGFIKYFAEKIRNPIGQIAIKVISFVLIFSIAYGFFKDLFFANINLPEISIWIIAIGGIIMFLLYDYIYTLALVIFNKRIGKKDVEIHLSGENHGNEKR